jgi:hypothetical protein
MLRKMAVAREPGAAGRPERRRPVKYTLTIACGGSNEFAIRSLRGVSLRGRAGEPTATQPSEAGHRFAPLGCCARPANVTNHGRPFRR